MSAPIPPAAAPPRTTASLAVPAGASTGAFADFGRWPIPRPMTVLLFWAAVSMVFTFTLTNEGVVGRSVDWVALVKLAIRAGAGVSAAWLIVVAPPQRLRAIWPWLAPAALFVAYAFASAAWSPLPRITLFQAGTMASLYLLAAACALYAAEANLSRVLKTFVFTLTALCAGLLTIRVAAPGIPVMEREGAGGLFHATGSAATSALGLTLTILSRVLFGWRWTRRAWPFAVPLCGAVLLISSNRLAVVLVAGVVLLALLLFTKGAARGWAAVALSLAGAVYLAADPGLAVVRGASDGVTEFLHRGQTAGQLRTLSGREEMWTKMWSSYLESPLLGHGYFVTSKTGEMEVWGDRTNFDAHNLYLQMLVTTGAIGAALFLIAYGLVPVVAAGRLLLYPQYRRAGALTLFLGAWYFGWGLLNSSIVGPLQPESVLFYVLLGLTIGAASGVGARSAAPASTMATDSASSATDKTWPGPATRGRVG